MHPLPIPRHARLDVPIQRTKQARPHEAHKHMPSPEALRVKEGQQKQRPVSVGSHERRGGAAVPRVQVFAVVEDDFGVRVCADELCGEDGARGICNGYCVADDGVEIFCCEGCVAV